MSPAPEVVQPFKLSLDTKSTKNDLKKTGPKHKNKKKNEIKKEIKNEDIMIPELDVFDPVEDNDNTKTIRDLLNEQALLELIKKGTHEALVEYHSEKKDEDENEEEDDNKNKKKTLKQLYPDVKTKKSAFQFFIQEKCAENKEKKIKSNLKDISERWKKTKEKRKWEEMAKDDECRYKKELEERGHSFEPKTKKRATTAFLFFSHEKLKEEKSKIKGETSKSIIQQKAQKRISELWKSLTEEEKKPYQEMYENAKKDLEQSLKQDK